MGAKTLSSRAIIGEFFWTLVSGAGLGWVNKIGMMFDSDQDSETYNWLGQVPAFREWIGGRHSKAFTENGITLVNKEYEATIRILVKHLRRDKTGQAMLRIRDMARRTNSHWASLLSTLMNGGTGTVCYDGQYFYDTDHSEGANSTSQSNDITTDISELPANVNGTVTAPSIEEAQQSGLKSIAQILSFKDNENEPMNEDATDFMIQTPVGLFLPFQKAFAKPVSMDLNAQEAPSTFKVEVVMNSRLTGTDDFHTFRTDGEVKPFILQSEVEPELSAKAEGSEFEHDNKAHEYGVYASRNVDYGYWQHACYNKMT